MTVSKSLPNDLIDGLLANYKKPEDLMGENGLLKQLTKALVERALEAEMAEHLGHDNAVAESLFQLLKRERIKRKIYNYRDEARQDIFDYIEFFYNSKRRHNSNNLLSSIDYKNQFRKTAEQRL